MNLQRIIELDVHGMSVDEAIAAIEKQVKNAPPGVYRVVVIHGFNRGNRIQQAIYRELGNGINPKVLRITGGDNPGKTELILREY